MLIHPFLLQQDKSCYLIAQTFESRFMSIRKICIVQGYDLFTNIYFLANERIITQGIYRGFTMFFIIWPL